MWTDANWAGDAGRYSTSGGLIRYAGILMTAWSWTHKCIALSSCEAELLARGAGVMEARLLQSLLKELGKPTIIVAKCDSSAALALVGRQGCGRLKHIDVKQLWLQEEVRKERLVCEHISGEDNPADVFTKVLTRRRVETLGAQFGRSLAEEETLPTTSIDVICFLEEAPNASGDEEEECTTAWWLLVLAGLGGMQVLQWLFALWRVSQTFLQLLRSLAMALPGRQRGGSSTTPGTRPFTSASSPTRRTGGGFVREAASGPHVLHCHCGLPAVVREVASSISN